MRVWSSSLAGLIASLFVVVVAPRTAVAERDAPLVRSSARWQWQVLTAPRLAPQLGALAVSGLEVVAGRASAPLDVLGAGAAPARWPFGLDTGARTLPTAAATGQRIAAAFGVTTFELAATDQGLEMLELRVRYQDGLAAWLNGTELVRAGLPRTGATALAQRPHGPEWETFYLPVGPGLLRLGTNVLAIEVHPAGHREAPTVAVELIGRRDRGIVRGPVLAERGPTTARIVVETDPSTEAVLVWGAAGIDDQRVTSAAGRLHTFTLAGLPARGTVHYRVHAGAMQSARYEIPARAAPGDVIRIGIYGDVRGGHATHQRLVDAMRAEPLDAIGVTGDLVLRGTDEGDWQRFFAITQPLLGSVPYLPAIGNHDLGWRAVDPLRRADSVLTLPAGPTGRPPGAYWYSADVADVHLVFLDSNAYERVEQEVWLEEDLLAARARAVRAILVIVHDGPYSRGYHGGNVEARTRFVPILARHRVDLVLSGHDHLYQRGEAGGIRYVVTGGGGAPLYALRCGIAGKPACAVDDGMQAAHREHHFLVLTIDTTSLELCARRPDGRLLEKCTRYPLRR